MTSWTVTCDLPDGATTADAETVLDATGHGVTGLVLVEDPPRLIGTVEAAYATDAVETVALLLEALELAPPRVLVQTTASFDHAAATYYATGKMQRESGPIDLTVRMGRNEVPRSARTDAFGAQAHWGDPEG